MYWLRWHYHVKDIAWAPYKIKKKSKQNRRQSVVAGRQQLYCAVQSRSPSHCQTTTGKVQSSARDGTSSATVHSWQATVERGFSINIEVESYSIKEDTFRATRIICDHVNAVGGIFNVDVANKQLQVSAAGARHKYIAQLEEQKKQKTQQNSRNRKLVSDEVEQLKKQKLHISNDIEVCANLLMTMLTRQKSRMILPT